MHSLQRIQPQKKANNEGAREAKKLHAPCSRFQIAASWLLLLISGTDDAFFPLRQEVSHVPRAAATVDGTVFQVDTSPWGGGATLMVKGKVIDY